MSVHELTVVAADQPGYWHSTPPVTVQLLTLAQLLVEVTVPEHAVLEVPVLTVVHEEAYVQLVQVVPLSLEVLFGYWQSVQLLLLVGLDTVHDETLLQAVHVTPLSVEVRV